MADTPAKKAKRRATIFVTGPQSKKTIYDDDEEIVVPDQQKQQQTLQDLTLARQRLNNELAVVNTASGIEILVQIFMDEMEILRHRIREKGLRMRTFFSDGTTKIRAVLFRIFSKSISSRTMIEYKNEAKVIMNELNDATNTYKMPRYTLNDMEEILLTDDLEEGIVQRRTEKWTHLPKRPMQFYEEDEDAFCEFRKLNVPMSMTFDEDEEDRLSMPSTRTGVTQYTAEDQMAAIQNQLVMLSKQLMSLQKGGGVEVKRGSSRASSRRGVKIMEKKSSIEISSTSSSSDVSEDEGKGPSVCSPSLSSNRKTSESCRSTASVQIAPIAVAPPPPPPPPQLLPSALKASEVKKTPLKPVNKAAPNSLPPAEVITSNRPYLTDIAHGRSLLKKTVRSPGGSPACQDRHLKRPVSSFEAALRDRFRGFHGDTSFSEQEENGEDDDVNATWDE
ncbi:hypothetical protein L5515_010826 [Caenorhabditis briggsae]|uniref:Uncharacterized protein n=1 Tax=Caenorhabditis briggsae TaxID=6238 RepID=A0AAE9ESZ2_CAEBR|nr:hypothetical protein L5515_010826 [Caenorhabditis briggsae]